MRERHSNQYKWCNKRLLSSSSLLSINQLVYDRKLQSHVLFWCQKKEQVECLPRLYAKTVIQIDAHWSKDELISIFKIRKLALEL